jgi:lysyl-tRNA synthetase class 2
LAVTTATTITPPRPRGDRVPSVAAWLATFVGLANVASTLTPTLTFRADLLRDVEPGGLVPLAHAAALPAGIALVVLAVQLGRRRRRAWRFTLFLLVALAVLNLIKGLDAEEAVAGLALAALLVWARDAFYVEGDETGARTALRRIPVALAAAYSTALLAVWAGAHWASPSLTWPRALHEAASSLVLMPGPVAFHGHMHWLSLGIGMLGIATLLSVAYLVFRPLAAPGEASAGWARELATGLVRSHGDDTLSFFKLRTDKHYFFSADRRAFAGYRIDGGVLLISGDPVGPADALPRLLQELQAFADLRGLKLSVLGASAGLVELGERAGLRSFYIGDEAIVNAQSFSLQGRPIRKVRQSVNRAAKAGFEASLHPLGDLSEPELRKLELISEAWRDGQPERGFSMAMDTMRGEHQADALVLVTRDGGGEVRGFLHFVPAFGRPAMSLSFMRREHDTPNGLTEFMVVRAIELLRERGIEDVSLNFAAFARLMHSPECMRDRLLGRLAGVFNPFFQIESLFRFNAKFFPRWEPRYLLYEGALGLPRAGLAAMWAEGQLPRPRISSAPAREAA